MTKEEAIEIIKSNCVPGRPLREACELLIPELRESEDEKIRKFLVKHVSEWIGCIEHDLKISSKDVESEEELAMFKAGLAYLESQKAKEKYDRMAPIYNDHESFEEALDKAWKFYNDSGASTVDGCEDNRIELVFAKGFREGFLAGEQKEQQPAEWSEEDKEMVRRAIFYTEQYRTNYGDTKESEECFNWLLDLHRNIRPPFHWKPSKEQMGMLLAVINDPNNAGAASCHLMLQSLYADLEKL